MQSSNTKGQQPMKQEAYKKKLQTTIKLLNRKEERGARTTDFIGRKRD